MKLILKNRPRLIFLSCLFVSCLIPFSSFALANETRAWAVPDPWDIDQGGILRINTPESFKNPKIQVFSHLGSLIQTLAPSLQKNGLRLWQWDGRDELGNNSNAGIYLIRVLFTKDGLKKSQVFPVRLLRNTVE